MILGLLAIFVLVLVLPFASRRVEENLEAFLFVMGLAAAFAGGALSRRLVLHAVRDPLAITAAVLVMGLLFRLARGPVESGVRALQRRVPARLLVFGVILLLGVLSSVITAIIASLVLAEIIHVLSLQRRAEIRIVVLACFATGLGAALTPIGEPLSTLAVAKLAGPPYHAGFWFLLKHLGPWVLPGILGFALLSLLFHEPPAASAADTLDDAPEERARDESLREVLLRAAKVYLFVMALVLLGEGFKPVVDLYLVRLPGAALFWINTVSAILDNATLTAAELSPAMDLGQIRDVLLGLLLAGGILIPGNIPNIIAAGRLKISMREWARFGAPVGFAAMGLCFLLLLVF